MLQFPHRLQGYSPRSVEEAFAQREAEHSQELTRLNGELTAARQTTAQLRAKLANLEASLQDAESKVREDMLVTLQVHRQGAEMLQAVAQRHAQQQQFTAEATLQRDQHLREIQYLQNAFLRDLAQLVHRHRNSARAASLPHTSTGASEEGPP